MQRLGPPQWPAYPPGAVLRSPLRSRSGGGLCGGQARRPADRGRSRRSRHHGRLPADCRRAGAGRRPGDRRPRLWTTRPPRSPRLPARLRKGLLEGGVLPVLKHLPGHGRATADSHLRLPVVEAERATLESTDFAAFRPLAGHCVGDDRPCGVHAIDRELPATTSATIIAQVIRGFIGFDGLLMSDDLSMGALSGTIAERTARGARGGLRYGASLQRQSRRDGRGRRARRRSSPGAPRARRRGARGARTRRAARSGGRAALDRLMDARVASRPGRDDGRYRAAHPRDGAASSRPTSAP